MLLSRWAVAACIALASVCQAQALPTAVEAALARAKLPRDALAAYVADADGKTPPRLQHRVDTPMNPASVAKLTTTFAGLDLLGPAYTWVTRVSIDGPIENGTLQGNLYVEGRGDPKLVTERLWLLLRRVHGLGIRHISGDIVLDHTAFDVAPQDPGAFDGEPLRPYNASPDALLVNFKSVLITFVPIGTRAQVHVEPPLAGVDVPADVAASRIGCADWRGALKADFTNPAQLRFGGTYSVACGERNWPVAYVQPQAFAARAVAGMWLQLGGSLKGQVRDGRVPAGALTAFDMGSPPLTEVVREINKFSNNVMAQQLFLTLGLQRATPSTFDAARDVVRAWWRERIGGEPPAMRNGSGLARDERITAAQLARLLHVAWASPLMPEFVSSLPLAGVDGTLRRGRTPSAQGIAHLKTGSLRDVSAVAGYVEGPNGRRNVLIAIVNHPDAAQAQGVIDALVAWTAQGE